MTTFGACRKHPNFPMVNCPACQSEAPIAPPTPVSVEEAAKVWAEDFQLLEEYDMKDKLEKTITHCLTKMPEENRKTFIINLCNGMVGSAILHFNNRYVKKLIVPDFKTTFK